MSENITVDDLEAPLMLSTEVYLSKEYAQAEADKLWAKIWQHAGRVEEIPNVGDYFTYEVGEESILIVRAAPDEIKAFYNVCSHRGRQLVEPPSGANGAHGKRKLFVCNYHGWQYDLQASASTCSIGTTGVARYRNSARGSAK